MKLDSATVTYVHRLTAAFFASVLETSAEFKRAFANNVKNGGGSNSFTADSGSNCAMNSAFLTWLDEEVDMFCDRVERQIFSPSTPLDVIAAGVSFVRDQSVRMREKGGLDVTYLVDSRFRRNVERVVRTVAIFLSHAKNGLVN